MFRMLPVERCPLCGGEGKTFVPSEEVLAMEDFGNFFEMYSAEVCQTCGTIYQNPGISEGALKEYYSSGAYRIEHPSNQKFEEQRADRLLLLIERFNLNPKSCLDIGCGRGLLLKYLEIYNYAKILGLDYDPEMSEIEEVVHSKDDVEGKFDLITCIHVMEHMHNPIKELEWMLGKLNPGGTILLELPTYLCNDMSHLFVPTRKGLEMMLDNLDLDYLYADIGPACNILIGENYSGYEVKKVYYTAESPDFNNKKEVFEWLRDAYN